MRINSPSENGKQDDRNAFDGSFGPLSRRLVHRVSERLRLRLGVCRPLFLLVLLTTVAAIVFRLTWLSDMEFKGDERATAAAVAGLGKRPWTPLAGISGHSGVAHSSGFLYLLRLLAPDGKPLTVATAIATFNALAIVIPLWWLRRLPRYVLAYAMCATSLALILGSRKIWCPDLQAAWICISIGILGVSRRRPHPQGAILAGCAAFCLVMAGHMYLPAAFVAGMGCLAVAFSLAASRRWPLTAGWAVGAGVGWSTFIPWAYNVVTGAPAARAAGRASSRVSFSQWADAVQMGLSVHTPYWVYDLYLRPIAASRFSPRSQVLLEFTLFWIAVTAVINIVLFAVAIRFVITGWRGAVRDPVLLTAITLLATMPVALFAARLGTYSHYWFAVIPFSYYWIAWAVTRAPRLWQLLTVAACVTSLLAAVGFAQLVRDNRGLPGEYGRSYSAKHRLQLQ